MATLEQKERFFAKLDGFDEDSATESESDSYEYDHPSVNSKRQKVSHNSRRDVSNPVSTTTQKRPVSTNTKSTERSSLSTSTHLPIDKVIKLALPAEQQRSSDSFQRVGSEVKDVRKSSKCIEKVIPDGLFKGLIFYFIPNNDVAKPRRLRIQSAISQGATWSRTLKLGITHIIADADIPASGVAKLLQGLTDVNRIAIVKVNWLIESMSHKSVRNPADSRFQLKGADTIFKTSKPTPDHLPPREILVSQVNAIEQLKDATDSTTDTLNDLDKIVQEMKTSPQLPFDEELDLENLISFSSGNEEDGKDNQNQEQRNRSSRDNKGYQCMVPNTGNEHPSPNDRTIFILQQLATYYDRTGDNWRTLAYRKAISALRKQQKLIRTSSEARKVTGIGSRIADKIEEIVDTDRLRRLDAVLSDPDDQVLQLFMGIYDVGVRQARVWMAKGYRTLDDLRQHADLSPNQKIGIEHHGDFAQRIPRAEVAQHGKIVAQALRNTDKYLQGIIGGPSDEACLTPVTSM